jgi:hypothetical protein
MFASRLGVLFTMVLYVACDVAVLVHRHDHHPTRNVAGHACGDSIGESESAVDSRHSHCCHQSAAEVESTPEPDGCPGDHGEDDCTVCRHGLIGGKLSLQHGLLLDVVPLAQAVELVGHCQVASVAIHPYFSRGPPTIV